ncbi:ATP-binding protein [Pseudomonas mosselii]|uniref:ATP-binding protein n=1 Tax=Pseudomonas mosselii TaxID=78327 RepID=UPI0021D81E04|nr:ATP-binding protein [Pseudomonas mosselii]MCU9528711.1 ATP-binding protein [Pseudomonas mosselii]MCU9536046.1 ATP-binding protein [Pseudomonas mosselii]MCU9541681.1 ATP-binding protein [Pseudomonas mosselii]MCU9547640.1 ATP-binding protein [Pseudomonas mosselii]
MKEYALNIDPRILELLGPNLYTNIYYVLAELIANAYDADARNVYVIANSDDIRVEDDGHGMSYENGEIAKYLNVAGVSRTKEKESFSRDLERRKMGRKGVGKLAALSVSEDVDVLTVSDGERSGFVLSRRPEAGNKLRPIHDRDIVFEYIESHGSAIVMRNPQYRLHKTLSVVKKNILKMFPLVSSDFRIHIIRGGDKVIIDSFDEAVMSELGVLLTLGDDFSSLGDLVPVGFPARRNDLIVAKPAKEVPVLMKDNHGVEHEYTLVVRGWMGTYKTTRGRKTEMTDFPDNFISLFANKKMGEFNILPVVGQNKLSEVYVVGQLHVDLFELTELPDMALSNRQGYKSDDPRYTAVLKCVRGEVLSEVLKMRDLYTDLLKGDKKKKKEDELKASEDQLKIDVERFKENASSIAADELEKLGVGLPRELVKGAIQSSINARSSDLGLKSVVDSQKKKILISQTMADKGLADIVYQMLLHNNVPAEDILFTSCDDEVCRIPEGRGIYDYLRNFFVESYSNQKMYVLFVTSENTKLSWGAVTEVGASWITKANHKIFNIHPFKPEQPLDNESAWQITNRDEGDLWMPPVSADIFCQKIEAVCDDLSYKKRSRTDNRSYLSTLVEIRNI